MRVSAKDIVVGIQERTGWPWREIARFFRVSPNSPKNWADGSRIDPVRAQKVAEALKISEAAVLGFEDVPSTYLDHLPLKAAEPMPRKRKLSKQERIEWHAKEIQRILAEPDEDAQQGDGEALDGEAGPGKKAG